MFTEYPSSASRVCTHRTSLPVSPLRSTRVNTPLCGLGVAVALAALGVAVAAAGIYRNLVIT